MMSLHRSIIMSAMLVAGVQAQAIAGEARMTCVNPASGTAWQIRIDYDRHMVDSNSATISAGEISWHDASDGDNYTLDRKSGDLTMVAASSTGGYFLHHHCRLDKPDR